MELREMPDRGVSVPSVPSLIRYVPSSANRILSTVSDFWKPIKRISRPVCRSQRRTPPNAPVARSLPSEDNAQQTRGLLLSGRSRIVPQRAIAPGGSGSPWRSTRGGWAVAVDRGGVGGLVSECVLHGRAHRHDKGQQRPHTPARLRHGSTPRDGKTIETGNPTPCPQCFPGGLPDLGGRGGTGTFLPSRSLSRMSSGSLVVATVRRASSA